MFPFAHDTHMALTHLENEEVIVLIKQSSPNHCINVTGVILKFGHLTPEDIVIGSIWLDIVVQKTKYCMSD